MKYPSLDEVSGLIADKLVSRRKHSALPLFIYNYTASAQGLPISKWPEALKDCRGLILDEDGNIVGRGFRKFWNYEQVTDLIPAEPFEVFEKLDGSLIIASNYGGKRIVATRGSFDSDQARWAAKWLDLHHPDFMPREGFTWLFEGLYPVNRIVVDYGDTEECVLLDIIDYHCNSVHHGNAYGFREARRYDGMTEFGDINSDPSLIGQEGFVVRWQSGFRAKVKIDEYKRLHRLITQCSTRTIWELLRAGGTLDELNDRVPDDFKQWVTSTVSSLKERHTEVFGKAAEYFAIMPTKCNRKEFAMSATSCPAPYPSMLFAMLDGKPVADMIWKFIEPKWATPFRKEAEE